MDCKSLLFPIIQGALAGAAAVALGFVKKTPLEQFDWTALVTKVPLGLIIGGLAAWKKIPFDSAFAWATTIGLVTIIDQVTKALLRRVWPTLAEKVEIKHAQRAIKLPTSEPPAAPVNPPTPTA